MNKTKQKYEVLRIELSNKCNLHCTYCRTFEGKKYDSKGEISLEKIKAIIDEAQELGFHTLVLTGGGEPFMRKDIFDIINYGSMKKVIITNGTLITESVTKKLSLAKTLLYIKISFEGENAQINLRGKEALFHVKNTIQLFEQYKIPYAFNSVLTAETVKDLYQFWHFILKTKTFSWGIYPLIRQGKAEDEEVKDFSPEKIVNALVPIIKEYIALGQPFDLEVENIFENHILQNQIDFIGAIHPCSYQLSAVTVRLNGDVAQCARYPNSFGSIYDNSLKEILESKEREEFLNLSSLSIEKCKKCRFLPLCTGGCLGRKIINGKKEDDADEIACDLMLAFEKYIIPILPPTSQEYLLNLIRKKEKRDN